MNKQAIDLFNDYNVKTFEALRTLGELNVATIEHFINKQVSVGNAIVKTSITNSQEIAAVNYPQEALQISEQFFQLLAIRML